MMPEIGWSEILLFKLRLNAFLPAYRLEKYSIGQQSDPIIARKELRVLKKNARRNVAGVLCRKQLDAMSVVDISDIASNGHIVAVLRR